MTFKLKRMQLKNIEDKDDQTLYTICQMFKQNWLASEDITDFPKKFSFAKNVLLSEQARILICLPRN